MPLYLEYDISSKQSQTRFREDFPVSLKEECDEGCTVVVDLSLKRRYFRGEWRDVPTARVLPNDPQFDGVTL